MTEQRMLRARGDPKPKKRLVKRKKQRKKRVKLADFDVLSLPKAQCLDLDLDLSPSVLHGASYDELEVSELGEMALPLSTDRALVTAGNGLSEDDSRLVQYRRIYSHQLPGVEFFDDAYHALLLTRNKGGAEVVGGGATFRMLELNMSNGSRLLMIDVLAVCTDPNIAGRGIGARLLGVLKDVARKEAVTWGGVRALLLTQADNACLTFWERKGGFKRAMDANALVRSLHRAAGYTLYQGAQPMAHLLAR